MAVQILMTGKDVTAGIVSSVDTTNKVISGTAFPNDTRIGTLTANTNIRRLYSFGDRHMQTGVVQKFEGSLAIDMPLYDKSILSDLINKVDYGSIAIGYPGFVRHLKDFIPQTVELTVREDELARLSVDGVYVSEEELANYSTNFTEPTATYPTHIQASIGTVDGVTNITIRSATVRVRLNNEPKWGFHSRTAQAVAPKQIEVELTIEAILDKSMLDKIVADTQTPKSVSLTIDGVGTITVSSAYLDSVAAPLEPNTEVYATLTYIGKNISVS